MLLPEPRRLYLSLCAAFNLAGPLCVLQPSCCSLHFKHMCHTLEQLLLLCQAQQLLKSRSASVCANSMPWRFQSPQASAHVSSCPAGCRSLWLAVVCTFCAAACVGYHLFHQPSLNPAQAVPLSSSACAFWLQHLATLCDMSIQMFAENTHLCSCTWGIDS